MLRNDVLDILERFHISPEDTLVEKIIIFPSGASHALHLIVIGNESRDKPGSELLGDSIENEAPIQEQSRTFLMMRCCHKDLLDK